MAACLAGCYLVLWFQENHCFQADFDLVVVPEEESMVLPLLRLLQQWWNDGSQAIVVVVNGWVGGCCCWEQDLEVEETTGSRRCCLLCLAAAAADSWSTRRSVGIMKDRIENSTKPTNQRTSKSKASIQVCETHSLYRLAAYL